MRIIRISINIIILQVVMYYHALGLRPWKHLLRSRKQVKQKLAKSAEDLERDAGA